MSPTMIMGATVPSETAAIATIAGVLGESTNATDPPESSDRRATEIDQIGNRRSTDGDRRQIEAGSDRRRPIDEVAPVSWPLVERRRPPQVTSMATDRRRPDPATTRPGWNGTAPLTPFRIAAFVGSVIRGIDEFSWSNWSLLVSAGVIAVYTVSATLYPVSYSNDSRAKLRTVVEMAIVSAVILISGGWSSPFALCLVPTAMLASFVAGTIFSLELVAGGVAVITLQHIRDLGVERALPDAALWIGVLTLVTATSGLLHRTAQVSATQQQAALDRVGRLTEANALLFSLQRVAQTLPSSLDLDEVLDSTVTRVQSLIDHSMLTVFLRGEVAGQMEPVRVTGYSSIGPFSETGMPAALSAALRAPKTVQCDDILSSSECVAPRTRSGLYAALRARGSIVGLIAVESLYPHHFGQQQAEILHGLVEPFGIAIDNARLFQRLRIVSADEERNRIARDLHDHIGSSLAFLGFEIDRSIAAAGRGEPIDAALRELRVQVTSMVGEVRETLYDLRSEVSDWQDLTATLREFIDRVRDRSGLEIFFTSDQRVRLPISHERELWHIAREALLNVERHAQATQASVEWSSTASQASLVIRDNGVGMLFGAGRVDSYGIRGMRERANAIGATMTTDSSTTGTVIRVGLRQPKGTSSWD
ncbi:MAG: histidine kinase [Ilumatobacteraceae bacterium]